MNGRATESDHLVIRPYGLTAMESLEGQVFANCRLTEQIGGGGITATYRAEDETSGEELFVTLCGGEIPEEHPGRKRFRQISTLAAQIDHPNLPKIPGVGQDTAYDFFVKEAIVGRPYSLIIAEDGPLGVEDAVNVVRTVGKVVQHVHQLKAADTTVNADSICLYEDSRIVLAGIYNRESAPPKPWELTFRDHHSVLPSEKAHVLSLGALLYHLVSGKERLKHKWVIDSARSIRADAAVRSLPEEFKRLLIILLRTGKTGYSKFEDFFAALDSLGSGGPVDPAGEPKAPPPPADTLFPPPVTPKPATPAPVSTPTPATAPMPTAITDPEATRTIGEPGQQEESMTWALVAMILFLAAMAAAIYVFQQVRVEPENKGNTPVSQDGPTKSSPGSKYAELVSKCKGFIEEARYGEALALIDSFNKETPDSKWTEFIKGDRERIHQTASGKFKQIKEDVERLNALEKKDEAHERLDHVILHFGIPEFVEEAKTLKADLIKE